MRTVLIVEDAPTMRLMLETSLCRKGLRTVCAYNAAEARTALKSDPPDLILLDLMMPGMNGLELLRDLHRHRRWKDLPVIIISARNDEGAREEARRLGVKDYLIKSRFSTAELLHRIRGHLSRAA